MSLTPLVVTQSLKFHTALLPLSEEWKLYCQKKAHFDPKQPQNHNVYISSMNNKYIKLHNGERWNLRDRDETIEDLFADAEYMLENKLETWQEEEDPKSERATKKFQIYLEVKEKAAMYNKIKQELKMLLFNNRSLITET